MSTGQLVETPPAPPFRARSFPRAAQFPRGAFPRATRRGCLRCAVFPEFPFPSREPFTSGRGFAGRERERPFFVRVPGSEIAGVVHLPFVCVASSGGNIVGAVALCVFSRVRIAGRPLWADQRDCTLRDTMSRNGAFGIPSCRPKRRKPTGARACLVAAIAPVRVREVCKRHPA